MDDVGLAGVVLAVAEQEDDAGAAFLRRGEDLGGGLVEARGDVGEAAADLSQALQGGGELGAARALDGAGQDVGALIEGDQGEDGAVAGELDELAARGDGGGELAVLFHGLGDVKEEADVGADLGAAGEGAEELLGADGEEEGELLFLRVAQDEGAVKASFQLQVSRHGSPRWRPGAR